MAEIKKAASTPVEQPRTQHNKDSDDYLNIYYLIENFFIQNRETPFTGNETKLYFYLANHCNQLRWKNPFTLSFRTITKGLKIDRKAIIKAIKKLDGAGLIRVRAGKSGGNKMNPENTTEFYIVPKISGSKIPPDRLISGSKIPPDADISGGKIPPESGSKIPPDNANIRWQNATILNTYIKHDNTFLKELSNFDFYVSELKKQQGAILQDMAWIDQMKTKYSEPGKSLNVIKTITNQVGKYFGQRRGHQVIKAEFLHPEVVFDWKDVFEFMIRNYDKFWIYEENKGLNGTRSLKDPELHKQKRGF